MATERLTPEKSQAIREMLSAGHEANEIVKILKCEKSQIYSIKQKMKKENLFLAEPEERESEETGEDFWKMKYLMAHALLVEHKIVE